MKTNVPGLCPLCGKFFPRAQLHQHIVAERPIIRQQTMHAINLRHPLWSHERGACPDCWALFRDTTRLGMDTNVPRTELTSGNSYDNL